MADTLTPVSAFLKLKGLGASFLLESVEGGEKWGRYSIIGIADAVTVKAKENIFELNILGDISVASASNPLEAVKKAYSKFKIPTSSDLPEFFASFFGYLSYDSVMFFEPKVKPWAEHQKDFFVHDALFILPKALVIFDNVLKSIKVVALSFHPEDDLKTVAFLDSIVDALLEGTLVSQKVESLKKKEDWKVNVTDSDYSLIVEKIKRYIEQGDIIQAVPSRRFSKTFLQDAFSLYRALRFVNPSPYMYYFDMKNFQIAGASPEVLVRVRNGVVETRPIAGTRRRGRTHREDVELERELLSDEKEKAEHIMLVDLARNDVGKVAEIGSVEVSELMVVERYSHVMHIVSNVKGKLSRDKTIFDALQACFPAGTVTGAPKVRAMQIIAELEPQKRGVYAGAVGYFSLSGSMDTAIAIRTAVVKRSKVFVQAGAGIVYDSVPELEVKETLNKAKALFKAVELAEKGLEL